MEFKVLTTETEKGSWNMFPGLCKGCGLCMQKCPKKAMSWSQVLGVYGTPAVQIDAEKCNTCGICSTFCPDSAIAVEKKAKSA